jgi:hypothetical protein
MNKKIIGLSGISLVTAVVCFPLWLLLTAIWYATGGNILVTILNGMAFVGMPGFMLLSALLFCAGLILDEEPKKKK